jgi:hypothetical protein
VLEASEVMKQVAGLFTPVTIVAAEDVVEAFSANYHLDLVGHLSSCVFLLLGVVGLLVLFS